MLFRSDYLAAAFLMAAFVRGLDEAETGALLDAMIASGETLSLAGVSRPTVDKHSTGGVADTVTLVFAPLAASLGLAVAKLSGRGLGHTGGTLDKLESIPGFRTDLTPERFERQVDEIGLAVAAQSAALVPADGALPTEGKQLHDVGDARCVAACYRCLMSYFNQPDHEQLFRRDDEALSKIGRAHV